MINIGSLVNPSKGYSKPNLIFCVGDTGNTVKNRALQLEVSCEIQLHLTA